MTADRDAGLPIAAAFDQFQALLRDFAPVLYRYYETLTEAGFDGEQAMRLVLAMQVSLMGLRQGQGGDDGA